MFAWIFLTDVSVILAKETATVDYDARTKWNHQTVADKIEDMGFQVPNKSTPNDKSEEKSSAGALKEAKLKPLSEDTER